MSIEYGLFSLRKSKFTKSQIQNSELKIKIEFLYAEPKLN